MPKLSSQGFSLGAMTIPIGILRRHKLSETSMEEDGPQIKRDLLNGSVAVMLETELDESTRIGGWIETRQSNIRHLNWAVNVSDTPEDDIG